ncbi:bifunctional DHBP synthase RibB-like alpha-beta domain superfamily/YrdC-like domain/Threonylcarbamoyl-AMP synthase [Babesia duncani]|uniref:Threonylcarbamoyl-AMP synthase n=1 Tax=Babesia duncani TaxID=323732 RepID=A0AAD9PJT6_9APIC|nr:bifunctional DHBP synthase RibB-like alpha-beta domain superfamily/YrdC-like domain/Threonylcarbamoyl-AMP synthase [Babesia duncani]
MSFFEISPKLKKGVIHLRLCIKHVNKKTQVLYDNDKDELQLTFNASRLIVKPLYSISSIPSSHVGIHSVNYKLNVLKCVGDGDELWFDHELKEDQREISPCGNITYQCIDPTVDLWSSYSFKCSHLIVLRSQTLSIACQHSSLGLLLHWRIGIEFSNTLKAIDLDLATFSIDAQISGINKLHTIAIACKQCKTNVMILENYKTIALPSLIYTKGCGSTYCEECENSLQPYNIKFIFKKNLVYLDEDTLRIYNKETIDRTLCKDCKFKIATVEDKFLLFEKSRISILNDIGDIFWHHSEYCEEIDSLLSQSGIKFMIACNEYKDAIEIVKGTREPNVYLFFNCSIVCVTKVLWRLVEKPHDTIAKPLVVSLKENKLQVLEKIKQHLINEKLIGLPTETVYGLAANGFSENAVRSIFEVKERPFNDPVILHVPTFLHALYSIFDASVFEAYIILKLAVNFSPGPLSIAARGKSTISKLISAQTGFPAARCPSHPDAQEILQYVDLPLAAPSANKFCHISPTCAQHVLDEFPNVDVIIVDGDICNVGIESTVVKIEPVDYPEDRFDDFIKISPFEKNTPISKIISMLENDEKFIQQIKKGADIPRTISIVRKGKVLESEIRKIFSDEIFNKVNIECMQMVVKENQVCVAPGMLLKHYSPNVATFLVARDVNKVNAEFLNTQDIVLIDFGGDFKNEAYKFLHWINVPRDDHAVAQKLYATLRLAEKVAIEKSTFEKSAKIAISYNQTNSDLSVTIADRLFRSAAGKGGNPNNYPKSMGDKSNQEDILKQLAQSLGLDEVPDDQQEVIEPVVKNKRYVKNLSSIPSRLGKQAQLKGEKDEKLKHALLYKSRKFKKSSPFKKDSDHTHESSSSDEEPTRLELITGSK